MQIDWFTLVAEIVNFLILAALLKRFLYGPVIKAMDEREANIRARAEEAEQERQEATRSAQAYQAERRELEQQREDLLQQAAREADEHRKALMQQVRQDVQETEARWHESVQRGKAAFLRGLRQQAGQAALETARKALADLATADLEAQMIRVFSHRLARLDPGERDAMARQMQQSQPRLTVASAFEIPPDGRTQLARAIHQQFGDQIAIGYRISEALVCGLELVAQGHKIAWSLDSYLDELTRSIAGSLDGLTGAADDATPGSRDEHPTYS